MKTMNNGTTAAKVNSNESNNRVNNVAMPAGEYGDLCYDYFGKSSVIVFGNTDDHAAQLEAIGGKYSDALRYSPLQNGRKWTEKQGRTAGYYFTTEKGKEQAVKYVQRVNHSLFDKYEQAAATMGDRIQRREDLKEGDRVRTIHGLGTVTAHEPKYNARVSVVVRLDKFTYNYGWQGMPQTFIECRCDEVAVLERAGQITNGQGYEFAPAYYEWHFTDSKGRVLLNWVDPGDNFWIYEDENGNDLEEPRPMTYDEVLAECEDYIRGGDFAFEQDDEEEFAGVSRELWAELPENAAEIMAKAIYYYYCYEPEEQEAA